MVGQSFREEQGDHEAAVGLALELYRKKLEQDASEKAAVSTLAELDIPTEFLAEARQQLHRARVRKRGRRYTIITLACIASFIVGGIFLDVRFGDSNDSVPTDAASSTQTQSLHFGPASQGSYWWPCVNSDSDADMRKETDSDGKSYERLTVRQFRPQTHADATTGYYAEIVSQDPALSLSGANKLRFTAQSSGLKYVQVQFCKDIEEWISDKIPLTPGWKEYTLDLNRMQHMHNSSETGGYKYDLVGTERVPDQVHDMRFEVGDNINPVDSKGTFDLRQVDAD